MKRIITNLALIGAFCLGGSLFFDGVRAAECDEETVRELHERKDDLKDQRDAIEQKIIEVKGKLRKCDRHKRAKMRLEEAKSSKKPL